jgi:hypothetical protein
LVITDRRPSVAAWAREQVSVLDRKIARERRDDDEDELRSSA